MKQISLSCKFLSVRLISFLMAVLIIMTLFPITALATTTPNKVDDVEIAKRIKDLEDNLLGTYFTASRKTCGYVSGHGCEKCRASTILTNGWFKNLFGIQPKSTSNLPKRDASSCFGFAGIAHWYIFCQKDTDTYSMNKIVYEQTFNYSNASKAKKGDYIILGTGNDGKHAGIFLEANSNYILILDCNMGGETVGSCKVQKTTIYYTNRDYSWLTIYRASNYTDHSHSWDSYGKCSCGKYYDEVYSYTSDLGLVENINKDRNYIAVKPHPYTGEKGTSLIDLPDNQRYNVKGYITNHYGNKWYVINTSKGTGYIYSGDVSFTSNSVKVTGVSLNKTSASMNVGGSLSLSATVKPTNATNKNVTWSSNNTSVATVSSNGSVSGKGVGTATITVKTADGGYSASCSVEVTKTTVKVTGITLNKSYVSVNVGNSVSLVASVLPSNATNKNVTWSSNNTSIATVSSDGTVTGKSKGSVVITAKTVSGGFSAECIVNVNAKFYKITYNNNGGIGGPSNSTKEGGYPISISNLIPEKDGFIFAGWQEQAVSGTGEWVTEKPLSGTYEKGYKYYVYGYEHNGDPTFRTDTQKSRLISDMKKAYSNYSDSKVRYFWMIEAKDKGNSYWPGYNASTGDYNYFTANCLNNDGTVSTKDIYKTNFVFESVVYKQDVNSGRIFQPGEIYRDDADLVLTAIWEEESKCEYTILFDADGGVGAPFNQYKNIDEDIFISSIVPQKAGYDFMGWQAPSISGTDGWVNIKPSDGEYEIGYKYFTWAYECTHGKDYGKNYDDDDYTFWVGDIKEEVIDDVKNADYEIFGDYSPSKLRYFWTVENTNRGDSFILGENSHEVVDFISEDGVTGAHSIWKTKFYFESTVYKQENIVGRIYQPGDLYSANESVVLTAIWKEKTTLDTYTVFYDANGGKGSPEPQIKTEGIDLVISNTVPTLSEYIFKYWKSEDGTIYYPGDIYCEDSNIILNAVWELQGTEVLVSGYCGCEDDGTNLIWEVYSDGTLKISGYGDMADYENFYDEEDGGDTYDPSPWGEYYDSITEIVIEEGITKIGDSAFENCPVNTKLCLPEGIVDIGAYAFSNSNFYGNLILPNSLETIRTYAFAGCEGFIGELNIGKNVSCIYGGIFTGMTGIDQIVVDQNNKDFCAIDGVLFTKDKKMIVTYPAGKKGEYEIPDFVSEIFYGAFEECENLTKISIPNGISKIPEYAFSFTGLSGDFVIPDNVTVISDHAFSDCYNLDNITIGASVAEIGERAFFCSGNGNYYFRGSAPEKIGEDAFYQGEQETTLYYLKGKQGWSTPYWNGYSTIPMGEETDIFASGYCGENGYEDSLTWTLMNDGTLIIDGNGYMGSYFDSNVITGFLWLDSAITHTPWENYKKSIKKLVINEGVKSIGSGAFADCSNICGELILPNSIEIIGKEAFLNCSGYSGDLNIPDSVRIIEECAFCYAGFTGKINIGKGLEECCSPFSDMDGITDIIVFTNNTHFKSIDGIMYSKDGTVLVQCPSGKSGDVVLLYGIKTIAESSFSSCDKLTGNLNIPNSVEIIESGAFSNCSGFTGNLVIPNSVKIIDYCAFCGCNGFDGELIIGKNVELIGNGAFYNCTGFIGDLILPDSLVTLYDNSFFNCESFDGVLKLGKNLSYIGEAVFAYCHNLGGNVIIPNGVTTIEDNTFYECNNLYSLTIGKNVERIGKWAFWECGFNGDIVIPDSVKEIDYCAFYNCANDGCLILGNNVRKIGEYAFSKCSNLKGDIIIPNNVTEIGLRAFYELENIRSIYIGANVEIIGDYAFNKTGSTNEIYFKGDAPYIIESDGKGGHTFADGATLFYIDGKFGWGKPFWNGYASANWSPEEAYDFYENYAFRFNTTNGLVLEHGEESFIYYNEGNITISVASDVLFDSVDVLGSSLIYDCSVANIPEMAEERGTNYYYIIDVNLTPNRGTSYKKSLFCLSVMCDSEDYFSQNFELISDVSIIDKEYLTFCVENDWEVAISNPGYSDYLCSKYGYCEESRLESEYSWVIPQSTFEEISGKKLEVFVDDDICVVINKVSEDQEGINLFYEKYESDIIGINFLGDCIFKSEYDIYWYTGITTEELRKLLYPNSAANDTLTYIVRIDSSAFDTFTIDYREEEGDNELILQILFKAGDPLGSFIIMPEIEKREFDLVLGRDNYSFINSTSAFGDGAYYISNEDLEDLLEHLNDCEKSLLAYWYAVNEDMVNLTRNKFIEWKGSCYGMSLTAALFKENHLNPQNYGGKDTYSIPKINANDNSEFESMINYYHFSQAAQEIEKCYNNTEEYYQVTNDMWEMANNIGDVMSGQELFIVYLGRVDYNEGHCVVCYGAETGFFNYGNKIYYRRLLISDPNLTKPSYIYLGNDAAVYSGDNNGWNEFGYYFGEDGSSSLYALNIANRTKNTSNNEVSVLTNKTDNFKIIGESGSIVISGGEILEREGDIEIDKIKLALGDFESSSSNSLFKIRNADSNYEIVPYECDSLKLKMFFDTCSFGIEASADSIALSSSGTADILNSSGDIHVEISSEASDLDFISINGTGCGDINIECSSEKLSVNGDLSDYSVTNLNIEGVEHSISVDANNDIEVMSGGNGIIGAVLDDSGDVSEIISDTHIPGDINGDGNVNNKDVILLFKYISGGSIEVVEATIDVNGDYDINNKDITRLFQFISKYPVKIY